MDVTIVELECPVCERETEVEVPMYKLDKELNATCVICKEDFYLDFYLMPRRYE